MPFVEVNSSPYDRCTCKKYISSCSRLFILEKTNKDLQKKCVLRRERDVGNAEIFFGGNAMAVSNDDGR